MAKRLHDTDCWRKQWFRALPPSSKLLWLYLLDVCDCAGIVEIDDREQMSFFTGCKVTDKDFSLLDKQLKQIDSKRVLILDFIEFQYGALHDGHKMKGKILSSLAKFDLKYPIDRLSSISDTVIEEEEVERVEEGMRDGSDLQEGVQGGASPKETIPPDMAEVIAYCVERKNSVDPGAWFDHYTSNGWMVGKTRMRSWKASVRTWERSSMRQGNAPSHPHHKETYRERKARDECPEEFFIPLAEDLPKRQAARAALRDSVLRNQQAQNGQASTNGLKATSQPDASMVSADSADVEKVN